LLCQDYCLTLFQPANDIPFFSSPIKKEKI